MLNLFFVSALNSCMQKSKITAMYSEDLFFRRMLTNVKKHASVRREFATVNFRNNWSIAKTNSLWHGNNIKIILE